MLHHILKLRCPISKTIPTRHPFPQFRPVLFVLLAVFAAFPGRSFAQAVPQYAGRPFTRIAQSNSSDPLTGFINGFGRSQLLGDEVVFIPLNGINPSGVFSGRGGPFTKIVAVGETVSGVAFKSIHTGFVRDTGTDGVVMAAGESRQDAIQWIQNGAAVTLIPSGTTLPNSDGKAANVFGEPYLAQGKVAVVGWHALDNGGGVDFRGVYRVINNALVPISDTATALPSLGVPDGYSSQVGFDGQTIAFWASKGPFVQDEGMFFQPAEGAPLEKIIQQGETLPDGAVVDGLISPPFVSEGVVYFFAFDSSNKTRLLKFEDSTLTVLAADGDTTPNGAIQGLGQYGLVVENGKVFFPARTSAGAALFAIDGGNLQTIIAPGSNVGGIVPQSIVLQDVAGDTIVLEVISGSNRRVVANLANPAVPVITKQLSNMTVAGGTRVEFTIEALGDLPLTYSWTKNGQPIPSVTGNTLVIESATATDVASYRVDVSNAFGSAFGSSALLNVEVAPVIITAPTSMEVEEGDQLMFTVGTGGGLPQTFFWKKDGVGVTSESAGIGLFYRAAVKQSDAGRYSVIVSNEWGQVISGEAVVTVRPAAPNPVYAGGRFLKIFDGTTVAPGTELKFETSSLAETDARWVGSKVVFVGKSAGNQSLGVFEWDNGALSRLIAPGVELPNSLGLAEGFSLVNSHPEDQITIRATQLINGFQQPVGIYHLNDGNLEVLVDNTMTAPESSEKFPNLFGEAWQAGGKLMFNEIIDGSPNLYLWDNGTISRVLNARQDLPVVGKLAQFLQSLTYSGNDFLISAITSGQQKAALLHFNAAGEGTKVLEKGETIPGTSKTISSLGTTGNDGNTFYFNLYDSSFMQHILSYKDGAAKLLLAPGMSVPGLGSIQTLESSYMRGSGGKAFAGARVATGSGNVPGIIAGNGSVVEPVLFATKLDGRRFNAAYVSDVNGDRVIVMVQFVDGTRGIYANVGAAEEELRLTFSQVTPGTIQFNVPSGATLEAADTVDSEVWTTVNSPEVQTTGSLRFFRLRK